MSYHRSIPFSRPCLDEQEIAAIAAVLHSGWITTGPVVEDFEKAVCKKIGCAHAVAFNSATAAMHVTLMALGIGLGDEVITPSLTWVSTLNMILLLGATPVFVDVDPDTLLLDGAQVKKAITPRTKAVIPVHFAGAPVMLDDFLAIQKQHNIAVIEDAAHAIGAQYKSCPIGQQGTAIFSFHAIKNMTCGEGGMLVTEDSELAARAKRLGFHGLDSTAFERFKGQDAQKRQVIEPGYKYNLPDINAAMAKVQLQKLDQMNAKRKALADLYQEKVQNLPLRPLKRPSYTHKHAHHLYIVRVDPEICGIDRDTLRQRLADRGIGTGLHFQAVHTHAYYRQKFPQVHLPHTQKNSDQICSLPLYPDMTSDDVDKVVTTLAEIIER